MTRASEYDALNHSILRDKMELEDKINIVKNILKGKK